MAVVVDNNSSIQPRVPPTLKILPPSIPRVSYTSVGSVIMQIARIKEDASSNLL